MARYLKASRKRLEHSERRPRKQASSSREDSSSTSAAGSPDQVKRPSSHDTHRDEGMIAQQIQVADINEDRFYVIEKLIKKRLDSGGKEQYLVRWLNYPPEYDSWEPREELEKNALDMIHEFERLQYPTDCRAEDLHCSCRRPYKFSQGGMIQCYECQTWYHFTCLSMNMVEANSYERYYCKCCRQTNPRLKNVIKHDKITTLYGNSSMARLESDEGISLQP